jgi:uncharacterized membrane protein YgcG
LTVWALVAPAAGPTTPEVNDKAQFFSADAVKKANDAIRAIKRDFGKDFVVETFSSKPPDKSYPAWATERLKANQVDGVYLLIARPGHLEIAEGEKTSQGAFPKADRDELTKLLLERFKKKQFDEGLQDGVQFVRDRFEKNIPLTQRPALVDTVQDRALMFNPAVVAKANQQLQDIRQQFKKDVTIETYPQGRTDKQYAAWIEERMKASKVDGIFVLITKKPGHIQIAEGPLTVKQAFTVADRDKLNQLLIKHFKAEHFDQGLTEGIAYIRDTLAVNLAPPPPALVVAEVKDYGALFSAGAVQKASSDLKGIQREFKKDVVIETFPALPANYAKRLEGASKEIRNQVFGEWMQKRDAKMDGIYVLICKQPAHIQVGIGNQTKAKAFTLQNRDQLTQLLSEKLKAKQYDDALTAATGYIASTLHSNLPPPAPPVVKKPDAPRPPTSPEGVAAKPADAQTPPSAPVASGNQPSKFDQAKQKLEEVKQKAVDLEGKQFEFHWIYVLYGVLGLFAMWVIFGFLRYLFSPRKVAPTYIPPQPGAPTNYPPSQAQSAPRPTYYSSGSSQPSQPARAPGYSPAPGYPPPGGYVAGGGYVGGGGGGGFLSGVLGGMFGAAAGNWVYDSMFRRSGSVGPSWGGSSVQGAPPRHYDAPGAAVGGAAAGAASAPAGYDQPISSTGADFGSDDERVETSGGDFAEPEQTTSGGDFGGDSGAVADAGSGGDFGSDQGGGDAGSGGDFGGTEVADAGGGGDDFGGGGGGNFGGDSGGGGDFGGGGGDAGGGSDF